MIFHSSMNVITQFKKYMSKIVAITTGNETALIS